MLLNDKNRSGERVMDKNKRHMLM